MSRVLAAMASLAIVVSSFAITSNAALGHERRNVGPYTLVIGWVNEPAYVGFMNALDLAVTETQGGNAVDGLAQTLQAEIIIGGGAKTMPLALAARFGMPGRYQGFVLPTKTGDYTFHIFGTVGTTKVDERFDSGPGRFGSIEATDALQFPDEVVSNTDLAARLDQLQVIVIGGVVLAGLALIATVGGLVVRRR
jgi:hypothetical protein